MKQKASKEEGGGKEQEHRERQRDRENKTEDKTDLTIRNNATTLAKSGLGEENLLPDHSVVLVVGVVGVPELPIRPELELQKLVPEFPLVPYIVPHVKLPNLFRHCHNS